MPEPSYDFFATGRPKPPADATVLPPAGAPAPSTNRFGGPAATPPPPHGFAAPPAGGLAAPPGDAGVPFPVAPGSGYNPGSVNRFGSPIDAAPAPTGPYAAPGIAAAPTATPGLVTTWSGPGTAYAPPVAPRDRRARSIPLPGTVLAAGILAIIDGALLILLATVGFILLVSYTNAISSAGGTVSASASANGQAYLVGFAGGGILWVVLGIAVCRGSRTWVRVLRILVFIHTVLAILVVAGNQSFSSFANLAMDLVMIVLLWNRAASDWLDAG
jgi:hypothetical protein